MKDPIKTIIQKIIESKTIPKGCIFDDHSIIEFLIQNHNGLYESTRKNYKPMETYTYHGLISLKIASFKGDLVSPQGECWSRINTSKNFGINKCWVKS